MKEGYNWDIAEVKTKWLIYWLRVINDVFKRLKMNMSMKILEHLNLSGVLKAFWVIQVL